MSAFTVQLNKTNYICVVLQLFVFILVFFKDGDIEDTPLTTVPLRGKANVKTYQGVIFYMEMFIVRNQVVISITRFSIHPCALNVGIPSLYS
jgi:hypothetical protein